MVCRRFKCSYMGLKTKLHARVIGSSRFVADARLRRAGGCAPSHRSFAKLSLGSVIVDAVEGLCSPGPCTQEQHPSHRPACAACAKAKTDLEGKDVPLLTCAAHPRRCAATVSCTARRTTTDKDVPADSQEQHQSQSASPPVRSGLQRETAASTHPSNFLGGPTLYDII